MRDQIEATELLAYPGYCKYESHDNEDIEDILEKVYIPILRAMIEKNADLYQLGEAYLNRRECQTRDDLERSSFLIKNYYELNNC
ncbi:unnamed protein product [Didymodactylos carnosus]|uniref:Uncharacterized protein n=2 Tax=Didymodactylos carnosus TaxID=1234261 RepID=A0A815GC54_9BILA|nr:unnamed protein product [Didymodactylos carnosus]CAF4194434.1 unnamed protein product [Didymodactylos carnosus]